jgi:predicted Zn-ribbon and HTH transcriptional regulator
MREPMTVATNVAVADAVTVDMEKAKTVLGALARNIIVWPALCRWVGYVE